MTMSDVPETAITAECEHHWVSRHDPGHRLSWVRVCDLCLAIDMADLDEQVDMIAADARAAERDACAQLAEQSTCWTRDTVDDELDDIEARHTHTGASTSKDWNRLMAIARSVPYIARFIPYIAADARAAERERIRQLAIKHRASCYAGPVSGNATYSALFREFADLLDSADA